MPKHKEKLNFTGSGYYGALSTEDGFGGFNYVDYMEYVNATYWEHIGGCENGYTNVTTAARGAVGCAWVYGYDNAIGSMETANLNETFSLTSMIAASSYDTNAVWAVKSYTYANGALKLKASDTMTISYTATKVDFARLGKPGDFTDISAVSFQLLSKGKRGHSCSGTYIYGYQLAFDALKVKWNGKIPTGGSNHKLLLPPGLASHHHLSPHVWGQEQRAANHADAGVATNHNSPHHSDGGYHSQLLYLSAHELGGLTSEFHLPVVEHFGS